MKLSLALLAVGAVAALAGEARSHSQAITSHGSWECNAYGHGGPRNVWQTVTGERVTSQASAKDSAMQECRKRFNGCRSSGCWQGE